MAPQVTEFSFWNEMWRQSYYNREKGLIKPLKSCSIQQRHSVGSKATLVN